MESSILLWEGQHMKIKYVSEDDLNAIRSNIKGVYKGIFTDGNSLSTVLGNDKVLKESAFEISDFQLDTSQPKGSESLTDLENIKRIYNNMRMLSDSQASDERIWAAYSLSVFIDYMKYRWPVQDPQDINNRYLFGYSIQRSLFRNGISRLWWIGRTTYDANRNDPYELTSFLCKNQDYIESICGRNVFNNPKIVSAVVAALSDSELNGIKIDRDVVRETGKYINLLAGTYILDMLSKEDIYNKVVEKLESAKNE